MTKENAIMEADYSTESDERNLTDVDTAILVATQSWAAEPIPAPPKQGERRIVWPVQGSHNGDLW
jgi:hypothetical protein